MAPAAPETIAFDHARATRIGHGVSADVYALDAQRVLKLMHAEVPAFAADREFAATRLAHAAGLPVPKPIGTMQVGARTGLILSRLDEARWLRRVRRWPGFVLATLAGMAREQALVHRVAVAPGTLPTAHDVLAARIAASTAGSRATAAAREALARLPRGDRLGHGDLHLGNLMTTRGGTMLIDWAQAMIGDPAADAARSELVMRFGRYGALLRRHAWPRAARDAAAAWYLACYRRASGVSEAAIDAWRLPVAVAWLREGSAAHLPTLAAYVDHRLERAGRGRIVALPAPRIQLH